MGQVITTPFGNTITHHNGDRSTISIKDNWRIIPKRIRNFEISISKSAAEIYYRIEERLFDAHPTYVFTTHHDKETSWGFGDRYKPSDMNLNDLYQKLFWIHVTGRNPNRTIQIDIHDSFLGNFKNSKIPQESDNFREWPVVGEYIIIKDYLKKILLMRSWISFAVSTFMYNWIFR